MSDRGLLDRIRKVPRPSAEIQVCSRVFLAILPIAEIAIGAVYLHDCPKQHYIPIYLVVMGVFGLVLNTFTCLPCTQKTKDAPPTPLSRVCTAWNTVTSLFVFCWFITGSVWIYSIYEPNYNQTTTLTDPYCNKTVYLFAFWTTTLVYIVLLCLLIGSCCTLLCCFICGFRADPDDNA